MAIDNLAINTNYSRSLNEVNMEFNTDPSRAAIYLFDSSHEQEGIFTISSNTSTSTITAEFSTKESPTESDFTPFTFSQQVDIDYSSTGESESNVYSSVLHSDHQRVFSIPPFTQIVRFRGETNSDHNFTVSLVTQRDIELHTNTGALTQLTPDTGTSISGVSDNESIDVVFTLSAQNIPVNTTLNRLFRLTGGTISNARVDEVKYLDDDKFIMTITKLGAFATLNPTITPANGGPATVGFLIFT